MFTIIRPSSWWIPRSVRSYTVVAQFILINRFLRFFEISILVGSRPNRSECKISLEYEINLVPINVERDETIVRAPSDDLSNFAGSKVFDRSTPRGNGSLTNRLALLTSHHSSRDLEFHEFVEIATYFPFSYFLWYFYFEKIKLIGGRW